MKKETHLIKRIAIIFGSVLAATLIVIPVLFNILPTAVEVYAHSGRDGITEYLRSFGPEGLIITYLLQIVQVISIIIPAPTVWIPAGAAYGVVVGMLICFAGVVTGNFIVFLNARRLGTKITNILPGGKTRDKFAFLLKSKHPELLLFFAYLLPGVPNSFIPYIYASTGITTKKYLFIIGSASIPSILFSTYMGNLVLLGEYIKAGIFIAAFASIMGLAFLLRKKIIRFLDK